VWGTFSTCGEVSTSGVVKVIVNLL
jgi:hypothetical protein